MQYCNDCFAKMDDKALHCKSCQSRDIRPFDTIIEPNRGAADAGGSSQETPVVNKIKVDPRFLIEPKDPKEDPRTEALYFHADSKHRDQVEKERNVKKASEHRLSTLDARMAQYVKRNMRRKRLKAFTLLGLLPIVVVASLFFVSQSQFIGSFIETLGIDAKAASSPSDGELPSSSETQTKNGETVDTTLSQAEVTELRLEDERLRRETEIKVSVASAFFDDGTKWNSGSDILVLNLEFENVTERIACAKPKIHIQGSDLYVYDTVFGYKADAVPCLDPGQVARQVLNFEVPKDLDFYEIRGRFPDFAVNGLFPEDKSRLLAKLDQSDIGTEDTGFTKRIKFNQKSPSVGSSFKFGDLDATLKAITAQKVVSAGPTFYLIVFDVVVVNRGVEGGWLPAATVVSENGFFYSADGGVEYCPPGETRRGSFTTRVASSDAIELIFRDYPYEKSTSLLTKKFYVSGKTISESLKK